MLGLVDLWPYLLCPSLTNYAKDDFTPQARLGEVVQKTRNGEGGLEFDFRADQIGRSFANGSPPLRSIFGVQSCFGQALSRRDGPRHSLCASA